MTRATLNSEIHQQSLYTWLKAFSISYYKRPVFFFKDPQLFDESKFFGPVLELPFKCHRVMVGKFTEHIHDNCSSMSTEVSFL